MADTTTHGFTREQLAWLDKRVGRAQDDNIAFDKATTKWFIGGIIALGLTASGFLYSEIRSLREDFQSMQGDIRTMQGVIHTMQGDIKTNQEEIRLLREDNKSLKEQVQANTAALVRIETILDERLPKN